MKLNKILLLRADFAGILCFLGLVGVCVFGRMTFPQYAGLIDVFLQIIIYLVIIFFCFCNLFVVSPWKEYVWSVTFVLSLVLSLVFTGEFNQYVIFVVWTLPAAAICASDYMSDTYKGCVPKKK